MNNGIVVSLEHYTHEETPTQSRTVDVRLAYRFDWKQELAVDTCPLIHGVNEKPAKIGAFSAAGIVTGVGDGIASVFYGMPVVIVGPADVGLEAASVCADISCVTPIPVGLPLSHAALAGFGAYLVNIIKSTHMPLGSVCHIIAQNDSALSHMLQLCGFPLTDDIQSADYIFVEVAEADISEARKNSVIVLYGNGSCRLVRDTELSCLCVSTPGADWCDARRQDNRVVYPHAYVQNTVADNVTAFLELIGSEDTLPTGFPAVIQIGNTATLSKESRKVSTFDGNQLGNRADEFQRRIKPAMVAVCIPVSKDAAKDIESAMDMINGWLAQTPVTYTELNKKSMTLGYADGSVATIQLLPAQAKRHIEIHWEGKSLILD